MNPPATPGADPMEVLNQLPYVPGHLILQTKSSVTACLDCLVEQQQPLAPALGSHLLDDLNRRYGLRGARPLRQVDAMVKSFDQRHRSQAARQQHLEALRKARLGASHPAPPLPDFASTYIFELSPWLDMEQVAREYARDPSVAYAEPERRAHLLYQPADQYFSTSGSWGEPFADLWGIKIISAPAAWDNTNARGAGIVVAVTDTGLDTLHPDIAANVWTNTGEIPGNGIDDDNNGYVDDVDGWNFVAGSNNVFDDHGHGTHVSGTIAARADNGIGVVGVAFQSKIMALKGLDAGGGGTTSGLAEAIVYAAENGANVINASWGGFGTSQVIDDAIATAASAGAVFVAAAGNSAMDVENNPIAPFFPAANRHAITVSATDHQDNLAWFSNFGTKIDVAAPGGGDSGTGFDPFRSILSLRSSGAGTEMTGDGKLIVGVNYLRQAGTSMAAPHVSGAAAVVLSAHPNYSPEEVRQALRAGADDINTAGVDLTTGYGRLNVARAAAIPDALAVRIDSPISFSVASGTEVDLTGSASGTGFDSYVLEYGSGEFPTSWTAFAGPITTPVDSGNLGVWDITGVPDGTYAIRVRATNTSGFSFEDRVVVVLNRAIISAPVKETMIQGGQLIEIDGTAAGAGFSGYQVEYRIIAPDLTVGPWLSAGMTLANDGTTPVYGGLLATFDSSVIADSRDLDFQVTVNTSFGPFTGVAYHVVVDPTLRTGWPRHIPNLPNYYTRMRSHTTIADLNGDGVKEIIAAYGDMVYVMRPDGSDMPGWPQSVASSTSSYARIDRSPAAADLDGDGRLEVVAANFESIFIWHADGTPMDGWPKQITYTDTYGDTYVPWGEFALTDLDGDGQRDLVFALGPAIAAVRPDGSYLPNFPIVFPSTCFLISPPCFEQIVAVGDVDGDGRKDIAVVSNNHWLAAGYGQDLYVFDGTGAVKPGWPTKRAIARHYYKDNAPILADVNGDGRLDVIANSGDARKLNVFDSTGVPVRKRPRTLQQHTLRYPRVGIFQSGQDPVSAGDITGDGAAEIFAASDFPRPIIRALGRGITSWWFLLPPYSGTDFLTAVTGVGKALPGWPVAFPYPSADKAHGAGAPVIGDIDGDGRQEVVTGTGICASWDYRNNIHRCYTMYAFRADGTAVPGFPKASPWPSGFRSITPAIGDLDGSGLKSIVWVDFYGNVIVWDVPGTPGPENMQWPMYRHDPAHTGALVANP